MLPRHAGHCWWILTAILVAGLCSLGCQVVEPGVQTIQPQRARGFEIPDQPIIRGTVASQAMSRGTELVPVRGYGLVVGLDGTGSRDVPPDVRAHMITELARMGIGSAKKGLGHLKPEEMLNSDTTAIVRVVAVIPPAAVEGQRFDVRIEVDNRTGATSLEGGTLFLTDLRPGPLSVGRGQANPLATAEGPVFVNPFAEPGAVGAETLSRTYGRILNGCTIIKDTPLKLQLASPSHARAMLIQNSINSRFPRERGQKEQTASGRSDEVIDITVPPSFRDDPQNFASILMYGNINLSNPQAVAASVRRADIRDPEVAKFAALRWEAMGRRVLPVIKDLYDYPEERPRLAALRAGANLNDALAIPHLVEMAKTSPSVDIRIDAITLMSQMGASVRISQCLLDLLNDPDVDIRLDAYDALLERNDPMIDRRDVAGKFTLDVVESDYPMIYITTMGPPRIAVFGSDLELNEVITAGIWNNRLMVKADADSSFAEVYYRPSSGGRSTTDKVSRRVTDLIEFFGRRVSVDQPEPGLDMTYAETVGAIYHIWRQNLFAADFKAEQDRILEEMRNNQRDPTLDEREDFSTEGENQGIGDYGIKVDSSGRGSDLDQLGPTVPRKKSPSPPR